MQRVIVVFIIIAIMFLSVPVSALELRGEIWRFTNEEIPAEDSLVQMQRAELSLIRVGPVRLISDFEFAGNRQHVGYLFNLLRNELDYDDFGDDIYVIGGLTSRARVDWPLLINNLSVIGSAGYRVSGNLYKADGDSTVTTGLYHGLTYAGGLGMSILPGLRLSAIYEIGPNLSGMHEVTDTATWSSLNLGLEYRVPFLSARAGLRFQELAGEDVTGFKLSGPYVGAGIHF